jgi:predicted MPP superfamily phosphohydrolase
MVLKMLLFLAGLLSLLVGAHWLLYKAAVGLFLIRSTGLRAVLSAVLLLLSLSFVASFLLLRWQQNALTAGFYMFAAVWIGLFINLLLAALLSWMICAGVRLAGAHPDTRLVTAPCFLLAVLFTVYGIWNAYHPRIKQVKIAPANLAEQWKNKTIVQLSDVHLGHFYGRRFLQNLVDRVNTLDPELVLITGDLFDGMAGNIARFVEGLNRLKARRGCYFITGNHETYVGLDQALKTLGQTPIHILQNRMIEIDGLQIIGISYPGLKDLSQVQGLEPRAPAATGRKTRLLLFHTPTNLKPRNENGHFSTYWVPETEFSIARQLAVDLQLSGHTHAGQMFPFGLLTRLLYKGFDYGIQRRGDFTIYTTSGVGTWGPPMRTGSRPEIVVIDLIEDGQRS